MAQNITLLGASYSDVPAVTLPKTGGGTATFTDTTIASNAASASDILSGKLAYVNGTLITGTGSGGGGGGSVTQDQDGFIVLPPTGGGGGGSTGLVYESGTWTPSADVADTTISLSDAHTEAPFFYMIVDAGTDYYTQTNTNFMVAFSSPYLFCGSIMYFSDSNAYYATANIRYRGTSTTSMSGMTSTITSSAELSNWATSSSIRAYGGSATRYWRSERTYKWIAVWKPTT